MPPASRVAETGLKPTSSQYEEYAWEHSKRLHPAQEKLIDVTLKLPNGNKLSVQADEIQLLQNLLRSIGARKALDVGTYTGYSALSMALAVPEDGKVLTCDITDEFVNVGIPFWTEANVNHKVVFIKRAAEDILETLVKDGHSGSFDFAFINADKPNNLKYYDLCLQLVRPHGIIAVDDALWHEDTTDEQKNDPVTKSTTSFIDKVQSDERVNVSFVTIGNGIMLVFKK